MTTTPSPPRTVVVSERVTTLTGASSVRRLAESRLAAAGLSAAQVDDVTVALGELLALARHPGAPVEVHVSRTGGSARVEIVCAATTANVADDVARTLLAGVTQGWGVRAGGGLVTYWAEIALS